MSTHRSLQLRRIGWLLTPLVVWAASFLGAWGGAAIAVRAGAGAGIGWMLGGALLASLVSVTIWILVLRRSAAREVNRAASSPGTAPEETS